VRAPWRTYRNQGNSLCLFRLVVGFVSLLLVAPAIVGTIALILSMVLRETFTWPLALAAAGALLAAIAFGVFFTVISKLTLDFVVPIMALRQISCRTAWGEFLRLTSGRRLHLVLYLLFQILLAIVVGAAVFAIVIATCCIAGCFLALPYLGTVLLLPVLVFDRAYSLAYLEPVPKVPVFGTRAPRRRARGFGRRVIHNGTAGNALTAKFRRHSLRRG
jgi:hypothetical protein